MVNICLNLELKKLKNQYKVNIDQTDEGILIINADLPFWYKSGEKSMKALKLALIKEEPNQYRLQSLLVINIVFYFLFLV